MKFVKIVTNWSDSAGRVLALTGCLILLASCAGPSHSPDGAAAGRVQRRTSPARSLDPTERDPLDPVPARATGSGSRSVTPPGAQEVARRALCLLAMSEAALFPRSGERAAPAALEHFEGERRSLVEWLRSEGAWDAASPRERDFLLAPVGTLEQAQAGEAPDRREALLLVLWSLRLWDRLPGYDASAPALAKLKQSLPSVGAPSGDFVKEARLRPAKEIERARETAEVWHLRAWAREAVAGKRFPQGRELDLQAQDLREKARAAGFALGPIRDGETFFRELIRFIAHYAHERGLIPAPVGDDFPVGQQSYAEIADRRFKRIREIAAHRLYALNWLRGFSDDWDAVPIDT